ncbi:MAG: hypothetical protein WD355_12690 [Balneolaceae bacterium]
MRIRINHTISILFTLMLVAGVLSSATAQSSDYEIQQDFRAEYEELVSWVDNAVSSSDLNEISDRIDGFEEVYTEHASLINSAIFPDTFGARMSDLRSRYTAAVQNIETIEQLNERVEELAGEVEQQRARLDELNAQADQLLADIQQSEANEERLSVLVAQYRQNIEAKDEFVSGVLQQLLQRYQSLDSSVMAELSEASEQLDDNPLDIIRTILAEYINQTDQVSGLEAPDYLRMKTQHNYFRDIWDRIGENVSQVFASDRSVQAEQEVTDLLNQWDSSIDNKLWSALTTAFNQNEITLNEFNSSTTFYNSLEAYVGEATAVSREVNSEEDFENFRNFSGYWNGIVKSQWGEYLTKGEVLTFDQISSIDRQLEEWNQAASPTSNLMLILFLVSIAVIIGLVVMLVSKK